MLPDISQTVGPNTKRENVTCEIKKEGESMIVSKENEQPEDFR